MKIERRDGSQERQIVIGMIVDRVVLARIAAKWQDDLFKSQWSNLVGGWCVKFFRKYDKAPGKQIESMFESWASDSKDKDTVKLVERFLEALNGEYEDYAKDSNSEYVIDIASQHFNKVRIQRLRDALEGDLDVGDLEKAEERVAKAGSTRIEMGTGAGVDILLDQQAMREAFEDADETLITYPGPLGKFLSQVFTRDALVSFMAPEKRGKSFWLIDVGWRAMCQRRKVAFFAVGDMSQKQMLRRLATRAAGRPIHATDPTKPVVLPKAIARGQDEPFAVVVSEDKHFSHDLSWAKAWKSCQSVMKHKIRSRDSYFKLSCHPNSTLNVAGMSSILQGWERGGWVPDVIIVDYADILAPPFGVAETRDQINATWKQLRSLSQSLHCCVVTATQSDAASYKATTIDRSNFTDDKRKLAHVNNMIAINQTAEEKDQGIYRLNFVAAREFEYSESRCIHVAGCLAIANPAIRSCF